MKKLTTLVFITMAMGSLTACNNSQVEHVTDDLTQDLVEMEVELEETFSRHELGDTFQFQGMNGLLNVELGTDLNWHTVENELSDNDGAAVFSIPVTLTNVSEEEGILDVFDITLFGPSGEKLNTVGSLFEDDITLSETSLEEGESLEGYLFFLHEGDGEYTIEFGNNVPEIKVSFDVEK